MNLELIKPKLVRSLRDSSRVLGVLVGFLSWELGPLVAVLAALGTWLVLQVLAVVVESVVLRDP